MTDSRDRHRSPWPRTSPHPLERSRRIKRRGRLHSPCPSMHRHQRGTSQPLLDFGDSTNETGRKMTTPLDHQELYGDTHRPRHSRAGGYGNGHHHRSVNKLKLIRILRMKDSRRGEPVEPPTTVDATLLGPSTSSGRRFSIDCSIRINL